MDLYIRSKDLTKLEKYKRIEFIEDTGFDYDSGKPKKLETGVILVNANNFGNYTEKDAINIINEIERILITEDNEKPYIYRLPNFDDKK